MDILISVVAKVAEYTVAPIGRQLGYLVFYNANFNRLTDRVKELEGARDEIKHRVEEERRNGKTTETSVQTWLDSVDRVTEKINELQEDPRRAKAGCSRWSFPNLVSRHQLSRKAKKMAIVIDEVQGKKNFEQVAYCPPLDEVRPTSRTRGNNDFLSRKPVKENIVQALKDPGASMIGLYGLVGVGKTTLVIEVAQIAKQEKLFDEMVMATVSETPDIKTIQGQIADKLGLRFEEETVTGRALRLCKRIETEKTILIILDDICEWLDLEKVGIPFGGEHKNCKLLMTSRNLDVLRQIEIKKHFRLDVLNKEETWSLFKDKVGNIDNKPINIATEVANKCGGLPILIITMARSLINQDIHVWKDALSRLKRVENEDINQIISSALEFTFKRLEGNQMLKFFLLCATIVRAQPLISDLFKYGIGLGIFNNSSTLEEARNRLYTMIGALKSSCLLLEEDTSTWVKMHDVVREVAISIASRDEHMFTKIYCKLNEWPTVDFLRNFSQIKLHCCQISKLPEKLDCPNLEFFYLENPSDRSLLLHDSIFEGMENIKVIDLTGMILPSLPTSLCFLTSLQTLCLDHCILENIDAIGVLKNLQILSLIHSSMRKLPSEIGNLTHLRMLDLSYSGIEVIPPHIISSLINLEELYMGNTSIDWEVENSARQNRNASLVELQKLSKLTALELQVREAWMLPRDLMFEKLERYKIVIGDVWEWSDIHRVTLKTLKLKLDTNIHLEHGIKALLKSVENLYLDEVEGISNVLYQLNGDGFPQLKHLYIQNNAKIRHIIDSMNRNRAQVFFPKLETLVVQNLNVLEKICPSPLTNTSFAKLKVIKVENCSKLKYLLSSSMVKGLPQLSEIEVSQCDLMEKIVSADSDATVDKIEFLSLHSLTLQCLQTLDSFFSHALTSSELNYPRLEPYISAPLFNAQVSFSNLDTLKLSSLNFNKIWEDNQHSFQKLTKLIVENCCELKYLFSSLMVESFSNLIKLEICGCPLMEEIIATEEISHNIARSREVLFSKLETIILKDMKSLKTIWHNQFSRLKTLKVINCEKIMVIFPSSMQKTYLNLETLEVTDCALVEEIFAFASNETCNVEDTTQLKIVTLKGLPNLKQTWSSDPQEMLSFNNLEIVHLQSCGNLLYLFPLSIANNCSHLKELLVNLCGKMKEIVAQKEGSIRTDIVSEFNQLNNLVFYSLPKLNGFYAEKHVLSCPSLRRLTVVNCRRLNLLRTLSSSSNEDFVGEKLNVSVQQSPLLVEQVIPNLKSLSIDENHASKILQAQNISALFTNISDLELYKYENEGSVFPDWFLQNVYNLKCLTIAWSSFKKIFQDQRPSNGENHTKLKTLKLRGLPELICEEGFLIDHVLEFVEKLYVKECSSMINLVPSSATFSHLIYLEIMDCNGMINLISSTTAISLAKLTTMIIKGCGSLQEIIAKKAEDIVNDISFPNLEYLSLECLPKLERFCFSNCNLSFPSLNKVVVKQCPGMKYFSEGDVSTPKLRKVMTKENNKEWHWKEDLNGTIQNMFEDKVTFYESEGLTLSQFPELKDIWYSQLHPKMFSNLKSMVVQRCDFLLDNLFSSNTLQVLYGLEVLEVRDCDSLEVVFDVKDMMSKGELEKKPSRLKRLTLSNLPKMKHIWNMDPHEIMSFGSLHEVNVIECQSLLNVFSFLQCHDLKHLERLDIERCGVEEIVASEEEGYVGISFNFPHLNCLRLIRLEKLRAFYEGKDALLECPSLKILSVYHCEALQVFAFKDISIPQALFSIEKVSPNLEQLALNGKDAMMMFNGQCDKSIFPKVEFLRMQYFNENSIILWNVLFEMFPNLVTLQVRSCYFETLPIEDIIHGSTRTTKQVRILWLFKLEHLRYICQGESQLQHLEAQNLEGLAIINCPSLITLVPSSMSFQNLKKLEVMNCERLLYLMTPSVAKSLRQLTTLIVKNCQKIEDVVKIDEEDVEEAINFQNMEILELSSLSSLRSFCYGKLSFTFSSLTSLVVKDCSQMSIFSSGTIIAPLLTKVKVENQRKRWKNDLNTTIDMIFSEKQGPNQLGRLRVPHPSSGWCLGAHWSNLQVLRSGAEAFGAQQMCLVVHGNVLISLFVGAYCTCHFHGMLIIFLFLAHMDLCFMSLPYLCDDLRITIFVCSDLCWSVFYVPIFM